MPTNRGFGVGRRLRQSVAAGTIASSSGSASVAPAPRRNGSPRDVLLGDEHGFLSSLHRTWLNELPRCCSDCRLPFMFIWNGSLLTTPSTSDENR